MDMMCVRVQDHLNSLRFSETSLVQEDVKVAKNLMADAKSSKTVGSQSSRVERVKIAGDADTFPTVAAAAKPLPPEERPVRRHVHRRYPGQAGVAGRGGGSGDGGAAAGESRNRVAAIVTLNPFVSSVHLCR